MKKMFGTNPKLTCKLAIAFAAAALLFSAASCSSDSSDGGTPFLPGNPVPTDQSQTQESEAQKEAAGSYTIGGTTYTVEKGKVTVTDSDGTKTEVGSVDSDGTIKITQNGTTTEIASATAADGTKTTTVKVETKNADGTTTTKTYTGDLSKGTLTNMNDPNDTVTVAKTETPKTDGTTNPTDSTTNPTDTTKPTDSTTNPTDSTTNPTGTNTNPTDSTTNPSGTNTNPTDPTNPSGTTTPEQQPSSGSGGQQPSSGSSETQPSVTPEAAGYTVKHYKQNANDDDYTLADTESLRGTVGAQTAAAAKTYEHFTAGTVTQTAIAADGSTEVRINYTRETVTFTLALDGGTLGTETGTVTKTGKYGQIISVADPSRSGYTFDGWFDGTAKFDFNTAITGAKTLTVKWSPATNTAYKVLHYKQNAENDDYTLSDTENLTGTTGEQTTAEAKTYDHFTKGTVTQTAIAADGSTEVRINYTRETVTFTLALAGGTLGTETGTVTKTGRYGQSISVASPTRLGFTFDGWNTTGGTIPATFDETKTYTALWTSAGGITATIAPNPEIAITKSDSEGSITLTAGSGFTGYSWRIDDVLAGSVTGAAVSEDGKTLTLTKASLKNDVYQVSLSATKGGIPHGAQITVSK